MTFLLRDSDNQIFIDQKLIKSTSPTMRSMLSGGNNIMSAISLVVARSLLWHWTKIHVTKKGNDVGDFAMLKFS